MQNRLDSFVAFSAAAYRRMSDRYEKQQDTEPDARNNESFHIQNISIRSNRKKRWPKAPQNQDYLQLYRYYMR
jgi:hypothetical protein